MSENIQSTINPATGVPYGIGFIGQNQQNSDVPNGTSFDVSDPGAYIQSAQDIARQNSEMSQAFAREQMAYQTKANAKAMEFSATEAQKNRDWQEMMSSSAHQREVRDLIAAGLNPVLSANQGASTPTGAQGSGYAGSGAKGTVDTSVVGALTNLYTQITNLKLQEKSIDANLLMTAMNNDTTKYAADRGYAGTLSAASMNSSAARAAASMTAAATRYSADINKLIYESGGHGTGSVIGQLLADFVQGGKFDTVAANIGQYASEIIKRLGLEAGSKVDVVALLRALTGIGNITVNDGKSYTVPGNGSSIK